MPDTFEIWDARKFVCAAVECLKRGGASRAEAAKAIAGKRANKRLKRLIKGRARTVSGQKPPSKIYVKASYRGISYSRAATLSGQYKPLGRICWKIISRDGDAPREIWVAMAEVSLEKARVAARKGFSQARAAANRLSFWNVISHNLLKTYSSPGSSAACSAGVPRNAAGICESRGEIFHEHG